MTESITERSQAADPVLDQVAARDAGLAGELFAVVDALDGAPALRRALTDPGASETARQALASNVFAAHVGASAQAVLAGAVTLRWHSGRALTDALERQGVRALLEQAAQDGVLDDIEDELFRFSRLVAANPELGSALVDHGRSLADRQALAAGLLAGKAQAGTVALVQRAVAARDHGFEQTIAGYVNLAAQVRNRVVATVRVAQALTEEQVARLAAALGRQVGRDVTVQQIVDPAVLGGVRVELGDEVIEGTVAGRLDQARRQLGGS